MRQPISIPHVKDHWQVIWRKGEEGPNWSHYVDAETDQDAIEEAKLLMIYDEQRYPEEIGNRHGWLIVEVRRVAVQKGDGTWQMVERTDPLYPRRVRA